MTKPQTVASRVNNPALSKSLASRITAPFSSKQRSPVEQEICLDEPFRQYFSGDTVKGAVLVNTTKALRITHLVIRLHGFVKVVNNARLPGETIPYDENLLTSMRRRTGIEYFGNGFARLFEDERVLCGDGRLGGTYEFRFELNLPSRNIPSSIDFEHGTISYLLTSTLTRPTTISPTLTIHHKLSVTGTIDIARLLPPEPHVVSLEAVGKKPKARMLVGRKSATPTNANGSMYASLDENSVNKMSQHSPRLSDVPPQSPVSSSASSASTENSAASANNHAQSLPSEETNGSAEHFGFAFPPEKIIMAKTELLQGGCLPGDNLPLRISVDHTKPVKTMQGVVITVFRQGRIDIHPALPVGPSERGGRNQYEDYYPRSRTGLGGLSLSSAGSSRVFRQDLAQTITPLIIDPQRLNANMKTSIQMPDHAFPTITCVPGGMISFKYYVEIVIDLRGKPGGQDRFLPHLSITHAPQHSYGDPKVSKIEGVDGVSYSATPGFNCLITDQIRRTKGVVFTTTEVVVGTRDSARSRGKQRESSNDSINNGMAEPLQYNEEHEVSDSSSPTAHHQPMLHEDRSSWQTPPHLSTSGRQTPIFPPPDFDEPQDEKSQIRRAEERLLPSAPPQDEELSADTMAPSAPFAHDEEDLVQRFGFGAPAPAYDGPLASPPGTDRPSPLPQTLQGTAAATMNAAPGPSDDKQELELQRLQALRSAPEDEEDAETTEYEPSSRPHYRHHPQAIEANSPPVPDDDEFSAAAPSSSPASQLPPPQQNKPDRTRHQLQIQEKTSSPDAYSENGEEDTEPFTSSSFAAAPAQPQHQHPKPSSAPNLAEIDRQPIMMRNHNLDNEEDLPVYRR